MARIGVCDDSIEVSKRIAALVRKSFSEHGYNYEVESYSDGVVLLGQNQLEPFDVLFLDIDMPKVSGFDIAKALRDNFSHCLIVFVTSHSELVFDSLDYQPFNFIRKNAGIPLSESVPRIVTKLIFHLKQDDTVIIEDENTRKISEYIRNIICIEASGHYLDYIIADKNRVKKIKSRGNLTDIEQYFEKYNFVRSHRSYLINLSHIEHIDSGKREIEMTRGIVLPIGKTYKHMVDDKYDEFLRAKL